MQELVNPERALGRVEGKIDLILSELTTANARYDRRHNDHETRLISLEHLRWHAAGAIAMLTALSAFLAKLHLFPAS